MANKQIHLATIYKEKEHVHVYGHWEQREKAMLVNIGIVKPSNSRLRNMDFQVPTNFTFNLPERD